MPAGEAIYAIIDPLWNCNMLPAHEILCVAYATCVCHCWPHRSMTPPAADAKKQARHSAMSALAGGSDVSRSASQPHQPAFR